MLTYSPGSSPLPVANPLLWIEPGFLSGTSMWILKYRGSPVWIWGICPVGWGHLWGVSAHH